MTLKENLRIEYTIEEIEEFIPITNELWAVYESSDFKTGEKSYYAVKIVGVAKWLTLPSYNKDLSLLNDNEKQRRDISWDYCTYSELGFEKMSTSSFKGLINGELTNQKVLNVVVENEYNDGAFVDGFKTIGTLKDIQSNVIKEEAK